MLVQVAGHPKYENGAARSVIAFSWLSVSLRNVVIPIVGIVVDLLGWKTVVANLFGLKKLLFRIFVVEKINMCTTLDVLAVV